MPNETYISLVSSSEYFSPASLSTSTWCCVLFSATFSVNPPKYYWFQRLQLAKVPCWTWFWQLGRAAFLRVKVAVGTCTWLVRLFQYWPEVLTHSLVAVIETWLRCATQSSGTGRPSFRGSCALQTPVSFTFAIRRLSTSPSQPSTWPSPFSGQSSPDPAFYYPYS